MKAEPISDPDEQAKDRIGQLLSGKWRLERLLGVGGMAAVYAAKHENNDRAAAIKVLHLEASLNQEVKRRFLREGYIANKVKHPGAVAVLDDGVTDDGAAYIVMELCQGETLHEHLTRVGTADEATVLRWVDELLDVLALAHEEGIVHRDLKPDNVFVLSEGGGIKVLDFGIARIRGGLSDLKTQAGLVLGTPAFMPPEQARGQSQRVDGRSDLWAVGAIMLAALTGKRVHTARSPQECLFLAMTEHAKDMAELAPELSPKVAALIDKALEFEPEARWDDALAMQAEVRSIRAAFGRDPTVLARAGTPAKPAWPPPPVLPGPPVVPRLSSPAFESVKPADPEPESGVRRPSKAPTKIETPAVAMEPEPKAERAPEPLGTSSSAPPPAVDAPVSSPPPPKHLQAEARSLESGSPLLAANAKRRRLGVVAVVAGLTAASFGAAFALQHAPGLRMALGIEPASEEAVSQPAPLTPLPAEELAPVPSIETEAVVAEAATNPQAAIAAEAGAPHADPAVHPHKAQAKPKLAPRKPAKKKRRR